MTLDIMEQIALLEAKLVFIEQTIRDHAARIEALEARTSYVRPASVSDNADYEDGWHVTTNTPAYQHGSVTMGPHTVVRKSPYFWGIDDPDREELKRYGQFSLTPEQNAALVASLEASAKDEHACDGDCGCSNG